MRLSIVIITYNSQVDIEACLNSVYACDIAEMEVIVVDNASTDQTRDLVRKSFKHVRLIGNHKNEGACRARNQGIEASAGEWVLALDSDVVLDKEFLGRFLAVCPGLGDDIGMIQANILNGDGRTVYSQGIYLSPLRRFHDLNRGKLLEGAPLLTKKIIGPCSAAAFYRRCMLAQLKEATGYFDERFFFLVEDVDLAWRAARAGWKVYFDPALVCCHAGNGSATGLARRQRLCFRNRYLMINKNESLLRKVLLYCVSLPYELLRIIYWGFFRLFYWNRRI